MPDKTHISTENEKLCEDDLYCEFYYNYEHTECLLNNTNGFYCNSTEFKTIDKCHDNCKTCKEGSSSKNNKSLSFENTGKNSSRIYPIHHLIITSNINHTILINEDYFYYSLNTKGVGIIFDYNSEINLIPFYLFKQIKKILDIWNLDNYSFIKDKDNNYQELIFYGYLNNIISFHFITDSIGLTFPNDILFPKVLNTIGSYTFSFLSKENQENIIIGKNMTDSMKIEFLENNEFIINNKDFISSIEE